MSLTNSLPSFPSSHPHRSQTLTSTLHLTLCPHGSDSRSPHSKTQYQQDINRTKVATIPHKTNPLFFRIADKNSLQEHRSTGLVDMQRDTTKMASLPQKCLAEEGHEKSEVRNEKSPAVKLRGFWWEQRESNPRPSACKADALNQLSYAPETGLQIYGHFLNLQILFHFFQTFLQNSRIYCYICTAKPPICLAAYHPLPT